MGERNLSPNGNLYYAALVDLSRKKLLAIKAWQAGDFCDFNLNNFQRKRGDIRRVWAKELKISYWPGLLFNAQ
jgi:hypothetical protein